MERLYIALAALVGGLVAAMLGWLESKEAFDARKFGGSAIRALIAGIIFAVSYDLSNSLTLPTDLQKEKSLPSSDLKVNSSHSLTDEETMSLFQREESFSESMSSDPQHLTEEEE